MATPTTIEDALEQAALNPKSVATDKGSVTARNIGDLLQALGHESANTAASKNHFGLRLVKIEAPGAG